MQEKENVLKILRETKIAVKNKDAIKLKELSNKTIHTASISQDPDNITVAVIVYSLGKIIERKKYRDYRQWPKFYKDYLHCIDRVIIAVEKNEEIEVKKHLEGVRKAINNLSGHLGNEIRDVFEKARINKASKIYEHGISMEQTARLLGISMWELASYAAQSAIVDVSIGKTMDVKSRIKLAMEMFE